MLATPSTAAIACLLGLGLLAGCSSVPPRPTRADLGDRVRIRIDGRDPAASSITTADYFLFFLVIDVDGGRRPVRANTTLCASSEGIALGISTDVFGALDRELWAEIDETSRGDHELCEDFVLPPGTMLCFEPGTCFAYRIVDEGPRMVAELAPEVRIGQIRADGSDYVELQPVDGPELPRAADPPGWPRL
ncbi:MAG: hypothetical protein KDE27_25340 [Planctomycetes bacterium]|nr:hypothetical protein [Planctomycetota bacterium]